MARYKVPQDVEAEDKLLGPFSFRQFVYLLIAGVLTAVAVGLFQIFPLLAIIPVPFILLFAALALPLKKDQPMETYLTAIASYYIKPRKRIWLPGQRESTIMITAPKRVDNKRTRDITSEEATHRLSFLADIVDTEGYAIKGLGASQVNEELIAEANAADDIFETNRFNSLENAIAKHKNERHEEVIQEMRKEIEKTENLAMSGGVVKKSDENKFDRNEKTKVDMRNNEAELSSDVIVVPDLTMATAPVEKPKNTQAKSAEKDKTFSSNPSIIELANNADYTVATIAKEANRIKERDEGEVFISLH